MPCNSATLFVLDYTHNHLVVKVVDPVLRNIKGFLLQLVHVLKEGCGRVEGDSGWGMGVKGLRVLWEGARGQNRCHGSPITSLGGSTVVAGGGWLSPRLYMLST